MFVHMKLFTFACFWSLGGCFLQSYPGPWQLQVYSYFGVSDQQSSNNVEPDLLTAFRSHYYRFEQAVTDSLIYPTDSTVLARLGDDLDGFVNLVGEVRHQCTCKILPAGNLFQNTDIFEPTELSTLRINLSMMQADIRMQYEQTLNQSHHGHPTIVQEIHTGRRGRPRIYIDPEFLRWAYSHRSTSGIARFLHVGRRTVRHALLEYRIAEPHDSPFSMPTADINEELLQEDNLLDPNLPILAHIPAFDSNSSVTTHRVVSFTGPLSDICDDALDNLIVQLRSHFRRAGLSMLDGMLRRLGHRLPRERIRESLMRIDPVQRVFQRIRIRRRVYSVPGPNSLWHHDGQHGESLHIWASNFFAPTFSCSVCVLPRM